MEKVRYKYPCQTYMRRNIKADYLRESDEQVVRLCCPLVNETMCVVLDHALINESKCDYTEMAINDGMRKICRDCKYD